MTARKTQAQELADLKEAVAALTALLAPAQAKPVTAKTVAKTVKAASPKPKSKKAKRVAPPLKDIRAYEALWAERVTLRKQLGLKGWKADATSRNARMRSIVAQMEALGGVSRMVGFAKFPQA